MSDPRLIQCLGVMLGVDLQQMEVGDDDKFAYEEPDTTSEPSHKPEPTTSSQPKPSNDNKSSSKPDTEITGDAKQVGLKQLQVLNQACMEINIGERLDTYLHEYLIPFNSSFLAHLSQRLIGELIMLIVYPWSGVCPSSVHNAQTSSSQKPLGQSKPNFMWSLLG